MSASARDGPDHRAHETLGAEVTSRYSHAPWSVPDFCVLPLPFANVSTAAPVRRAALTTLSSRATVADFLPARDPMTTGSKSMLVKLCEVSGLSGSTGHAQMIR